MIKLVDKREHVENDVCEAGDLVRMGNGTYGIIIPDNNLYYIFDLHGMFKISNVSGSTPEDVVDSMRETRTGVMEVIPQRYVSIVIEDH